MAVLGIDTSNYRTSLCIIDHKYQIIAEVNPLLPVKEGELGLQQSAALFAHIQSWPTLLAKLPKGIQLEAVGVSNKPRPQVNSYMPVFKVGELIGETVAHFLDIPLIKTSHQEGHIAAGEYSAFSRPRQEAFLAVHLSGGTSEILQVKRCFSGYEITLLGGTKDLHTGQFIDRVGVALGLPFPAGPHLERLATSCTEEDVLPIIPSYAQGMDFSFSGPASAALRIIEQNTYPPHTVARAVEKTIAKTLEKVLLQAMEKTGLKEILLVGGVAANVYITERLVKRLEHPAVGGKLCVASAKYATDNAFGVACLALDTVTERWRERE